MIVKTSFKLDVLDSQTADYYYCFLSPQILLNPTGQDAEESPSGRADLTARLTSNNKNQYCFNPF